MSNFWKILNQMGGKFNYLDESEYEDDYSHNEIYAAHDDLIFMIKEYLHKNHPGKWVVWSDWAVHVFKVENVRNASLVKTNKIN